ncbi:MAG TPA: chorismate mutase, partial [Polyangiaceae bacterium]|nr:chorismate mutase [Polyangiaceae bacterium]
PLRQGRNPGKVAGVNLPGLSELRQEIDAVDSQILSLLHRRLELVYKVGEIKSVHGVKVYDPERERLMLARLGSMAKPPMAPDTVRRIFERIIDEFRSQEKHHIQEL